MDKIKKYFSREKLSETVSEWKWLFRYITRYKKSIILYIIVGVIGVLLGLWASIAGKDLINTVINKENGRILGIGALVIGLALLQIVTSSINKRQNIKISSTVTNDLRQEIFGKLLNSRWEYLSAFHTGEVLNRLEGDVNCIAGGVVSFIPNLVTRGVQFIGVFCIILYYDPAMAFISLGSAPILFFSSRYLMRIMRKYNEKMRESNGAILAYNEEVFQNIQLVKAFDLAPEYGKGLDGLLVTDRRLKLEHNKFSIITHALFAVLGIIVAYLCYGWGVYRLWTGRIDYGVMTLFLQLAGTLRTSFSEIVSMIPTAISTATSAGRVIELTALPAENDADGEKAAAMLREAKECGVELFAEGLCFTYRGADESNLNGIGFTVKPGETVAFVGPSGGGKTTTLRLILALLEPEKGRLEVRCRDRVLPVSESTRRLCSYVPQGNQIFSGTVAGNLRVALPGATDEELWQALEIADARSFVEKLPDGLYTELRERGENLSEGQRQRIAIARAVLKDAPILVMDEATSALDTETENRVLRNLMKKNPRRICVITTHRKSMLEFSHRVYEISGGNIKKITDISGIEDVKEREEA